MSWVFAILAIVLICLIVWPLYRFRDEIFHETFWRNIGPNIIATFLGVLAGSFFGFWIQSCSSNREHTWQQRQSLCNTNELKIQLLHLISESLSKNRNTLEADEKELGEIIKTKEANKVVYTNYDAQFLEATTERRYEILDDMQLNYWLEDIHSWAMLFNQMLLM